MKRKRKGFTLIELIAVALIIALLAGFVAPKIFKNLGRAKGNIAIGQIAQNVFGLFVIVSALKIFPFDFSPYRINWTTITRVVLIMLAILIGIGTIAEFVKLIRSLGGANQSEP